MTPAKTLERDGCSADKNDIVGSSHYGAHWKLSKHKIYFISNYVGLTVGSYFLLMLFTPFYEVFLESIGKLFPWTTNNYQLSDKC